MVTEFRFRAEMRIGIALHQPDDAVHALAEYAQIYPELSDHVGWHAALKQSMLALPFVPEHLHAMARVPDDATAFANRQHNWWLNFALHWDHAPDDATNVTQIRAAHDALKPWLGKGVYANMLNFDEADRLIDAYGVQERYERLGRLKAQYDPGNSFRSNNATIAPALEQNRVAM